MCSSWAFEFFKMIFPSWNITASLTQKNLLACISPFRGMHPPPINFPQLLQFHKSWCSHFHPIWKKVWKNVFSSNISKILEFILNKEMKHRKKERKKHRNKRERKKSPKSLSLLKKGNSIFWEEKTFSKLFRVSPFSPPPFYHFKTHFSNHLKVLDSFGTIS
jgi:hypothetical protein